MKKKIRRRGDLSSLCGEAHADDGVDPRTAFVRIEKAGSAGGTRKSRQLCKQVRRAIATTLAGEIGDPALRDLEVASVVPAPDDARLRITLVVSTNLTTDREPIRAALLRATGLLRTRVAESITRKRTPQLDFAIEQAPPRQFDFQSEGNA